MRRHALVQWCNARGYACGRTSAPSLPGCGQSPPHRSGARRTPPQTLSAPQRCLRESSAGAWTSAARLCHGGASRSSIQACHQGSVRLCWAAQRPVQARGPRRARHRLRAAAPRPVPRIARRAGGTPGVPPSWEPATPARGYQCAGKARKYRSSAGVHCRCRLENGGNLESGSSISE